MEKHAMEQVNASVLPLDYFSLRRYFSKSILATFFERYWIVDWTIPDGEEYKQQLIPYPCTNMVIEKGNSGIFGIETGISEKILKGTGWVIGIKFKIGAFFPFCGFPVSDLSNSRIMIDSVFPWFTEAIEKEILTLNEDSSVIEKLEEFFLEALPSIANGELELLKHLQWLLSIIMKKSDIWKVDHILQFTDWSKRTLQRKFHQYVGVSPKWIIQRFRLQEAADALAQNCEIDLTDLAYKLGYFDQSHFINDFKKVIGVSPGNYEKDILK